MYASTWRRFEAWIAGRDRHAIPASPVLVAAYLDHLAKQGIDVAPPSDSAAPL